jgi:hypothetical protein
LMFGDNEPVKSRFTLFVIPCLTKPAPDLIRGNPVIYRIPAGVYPRESGGRNDRSVTYCEGVKDSIIRSAARIPSRAELMIPPA